VYRVTEAVIDRGAESFRGVADIRDDETKARRAADRMARRPGHATAVAAYVVLDTDGREVYRAAVACSTVTPSS